MFFWFAEGVSSPEAGKSPIIGSRNDSKASPNPPASPAGNKLSPTSADWPAQSDEDIDRLVAMHQNRSSLSSLGVSNCIWFIITNVNTDFDRQLFVWFLTLAALRLDGKCLFWRWRGSIRNGHCKGTSWIRYAVQLQARHTRNSCRAVQRPGSSRYKTQPKRSIREGEWSVTYLSAIHCTESQLSWFDPIWPISVFIYSMCPFSCRCICCPTSRRMANAKQKSESTLWIPYSMKRSNISCHWIVWKQERCG